MLYIDIPTHPEIRALFEARADACVSIYLPTTPETQNVTLSRISFGNLTRTALEQLDAVGFDKRRRAALEEHLLALDEMASSGGFRPTALRFSPLQTACGPSVWRQRSPKRSRCRTASISSR